LGFFLSNRAARRLTTSSPQCYKKEFAGSGFFRLQVAETRPENNLSDAAKAKSFRVFGEEARFRWSKKPRLGTITGSVHNPCSQNPNDLFGGIK